MLETNVLALLVGCKAAVAAMRACGSQGRIVNISSVAAREPTSGVFGATEHAVNVVSDTFDLSFSTTRFNSQRSCRGSSQRTSRAR